MAKTTSRKTPVPARGANSTRKTAASTPSLHAVIDGTCSLRIPDVASPPPLDGYALRCEVEFSADRRSVTLHRFDPLSTPEYQATVGFASMTNITTVRMRSAERGTLTPDGHVEIPVILHFDHSIDAPFIDEDSDLPITLSTSAAGGRPLDARGMVTLTGEGTFDGGHLSGKRCRLTYQARVTPGPW